MRKKISNFIGFISEASLRGNVGIPGEEGSGRESWLDKINRGSDASAREFAMANRADIGNFMGFVMKAQELQRGHERDLERLLEECVRQVFGSLVDDIEFDLTLGDREEVAQMMEETPTEIPEMEEITDESILDAIQARKIMRTVQQGKGLAVKEILNLKEMKDGLVEIMGERDAAEYIRACNKIANIAQFFDWTVPEDIQKGAWRSRGGFSGSVELEFPEEEEDDKKNAAEQVLKDLENGDDLINNPEAEELMSGANTTIVAIGVDLSVLTHEAVKGVWALPVQWSLELLSEDEAEQVIGNTDTLFDELQEIKYGRQMQQNIFKIVSRNPKVIEKIHDMQKMEDSDSEIIYFQEQLNFLFFGKLVAIAREGDNKEFLRRINDILSENAKAIEDSDPLIEEALDDLEQEAKYQSELRGEGSDETDVPYGELEYEEEEETSDYEPTDYERPPSGSQMSKDEIANAIIDAYQRGDMEEAQRLRAMLPESHRFPRFKDYQRLFERRK